MRLVSLCTICTHLREGCRRNEEQVNLVRSDSFSSNFGCFEAWTLLLFAQLPAEIERREKAKKAKEEAVERAATALKKAQSAAFRWPWQKPREVKEEGFPESTLKETQESSANVEIASSVSIDVAKLSSDSKDLLPPSRPLSPYTRFMFLYF